LKCFRAFKINDTFWRLNKNLLGLYVQSNFVLFSWVNKFQAHYC
jgi:hypothetical protein